MMPDLFEIKDRIRRVGATDFHGTEEKAIRAKMHAHLLEVGSLDLKERIQIEKVEKADGNRYSADIVVLTGGELISLLGAIDEAVRLSHHWRNRAERLQRLRASEDA
jgi:tRNA U34 5-carboxymethylaminomethyl modifying enzyme MnmG/GidA